MDNMDKVTLAFKWGIHPLTEDLSVAQVLAQSITKIPDLCQYGKNTSDPATASFTPRQEFIAELVDVIASDGWTQQDMREFGSSLSVQAAKIFGEEGYCLSDDETFNKVSDKWHDAMTNLGFRNASIKWPSDRHGSSYKAWSAAQSEGSAGPANNGP